MSVSVLISEQGDFKTKSINTDTDGIFHKSERIDSKQIHAEVHEISVQLLFIFHSVDTVSVPVLELAPVEQADLDLMEAPPASALPQGWD